MSRAEGPARRTTQCKLWVLRWAGLYPTFLLAYGALGPWVGDWLLALRVLLMSGIGKFSLSFLIMPVFNRWFAGWLGKRD